MKKTIILDGSPVAYEFRKGRGRGVRVSIGIGGEIRVTAGRFFPQFRVDSFLRSKSDWILETVRRMKSRPEPLLKRSGKREYLKHKEAARVLAKSRLEHFNRHYGFSWGRIAIRNQRSRWGSCSKSGNLNFNYQIALLPPRLADYIIVHELCHVKQFDHSRKFWDLVAETIPDWKQLRKELRGGKKVS